MLENPVTVVIPIYGKAQLTVRAVTSVIENVNLEKNRLIVINDGGPEREEIRRTLLNLLAGLSNATYVENQTNLGFVLSCNRVVEELDHSANDILILNSDAALTKGAVEELVDVLSVSERHAIAVPRTSNGPIASFPSNPRTIYSENESHLLFLKHHKELPRYSLVPTAPGFCVLLKRKVIENYGLFDSWFSPGYDEENDFILRVNQAGYSTVLANHAFVFHAGSQSFGNRRPVLQAKHAKELLRRYPYFPELLSQYFDFRIDPVDMFADFLETPAIPRVLIDCSQLALITNGTSKNILSFLYFISEKIESKHLNWDVTILASSEAIDFYGLAKSRLKVISAEGECDEVFDVGVAVSPIWNIESLCRLSDTCSRIVISHLDIIALRAGQLIANDKARETAVFSALEWADCTVFISESALQDIRAFSPQSPIRSHVIISQGNPTEFEGWKKVDNKLARVTQDFVGTSQDETKVLIVGNGFPHKQVELAIGALDNPVFEVVALGSQNKQQGAVRQIASGKVAEHTIAELHNQADVIVIPSAYEGYGLSIPQAIASGKPVVVFETETSREVVSGLSANQNVTFFDKFSELKNIVMNAKQENRRTKTSPLRTISDYNSEFVETIEQVLSTPVEISLLRQRVHHLRKLKLAHSQPIPNHSWVDAQLSRRSVRWSTTFADIAWGPIYQHWQKFINRKKQLQHDIAERRPS